MCTDLQGDPVTEQTRGWSCGDPLCVTSPLVGAHTIRPSEARLWLFPYSSHSLDDHSSHQTDGQSSCLLVFSVFSFALAPRPPVHMLGRAGGSSIGSSASCALGSRGSIIILPLCSLPSDGFEPRLYSVCLFAFVRSCLFVIPPPLLPSRAPTLPPLPTFGRPHRVWK